jgi:predicted alpha/beta-fold hydrolase
VSAHARALARTAQTLGDFDDAFIAPVYGFRDKYDYYTQVCKDTVVKTQ